MASESMRLELPATSRIAPLLVASDRCIAPKPRFCAAVITRRWHACNIEARGVSPCGKFGKDRRGFLKNMKRVPTVKSTQPKYVFCVVFPGKQNQHVIGLVNPSSRR